MSEQLRLQGFEETECAADYNVYISGRLVAKVNTEEEAWDVIGRHPFGALHEVRDKRNEIRLEFIPF